MSREHKQRLEAIDDESDFSNRLMAIAGQIQRDFDGPERTRLLALVRETLERHVEIRNNTQRAHEALLRLHADQQALLQLFEFITARSESQTLH